MAHSRKRRRKNATMTVHGADARAAVAAISDIARLAADPDYGSQETSFQDVAIALDRAMQGEPVFNAEESREALKEYDKSSIRREYYSSIASMAENILDQAAEDFDSYEEAQEWIYEQVEEYVDGSEWVIYTAKHIIVLYASDNWLAIEDAAREGIVDETNLSDFTRTLQLAAFFAVRADLTERIEYASDEVQWRADQEDDFEDNPKRTRKLKARLLR